MRSLFMVALLLCASLSGCLGEDLLLAEDCSEFEATLREDDGVLRVLTYDIASLSEEFLQDFTNETGIEVELIRADDAGSILEQVLLYGGAPQVDVALGLDGSYLPFAVNRCLIQLHGVDLTGLDGAVLEEGASLTDHGVPFDHGYICLNVDGAVVETMPTSLWNLTEDEWTGKVAIPSPLSSSPGRAFFLATLQGLGDDAWSWWEAMLLNEPIITTGWSEAYETHYSGGYGVWEEGHVGDAAATVSYCHSPGVEAYYSDNSTQSTAIALPGAVYHQIEYGAVLAGAANTTAAEAFLAHLVSPEANAQMPYENLMYSVLEGADLPETNGYRHHSLVPEDAAAALGGMDVATLEVMLATFSALLEG